MKYTYFGFSQAKAVELELDLVDLAILRYFIDFKDSGSMVIEIIENEPYYWVKYDSFREANPILGVNSNRALSRRMKKLIDKKVLKKHIKKRNGTYTFYGIGENYKFLIDDIHRTQKSYSTGLKSPVTPDSKVQPKDYSIKDSSIKELNNIYTGNSKEKESQITEEEKKIQSIYEEWKKANIINHRRITRAMKTKIKSALKDYTEEEIKQSIRNYSYIVNNDNYFFSHRWTLDQFCTITQKDRIGNFLDLEVAKNNYKANKGDIGNGGNERHNIKNEDDSRKEYEEFEAEYFEKWKI